MKHQFAIGIDLGTTNCEMACVALDQENAAATLLDIPQLTSAGNVEVKKLLPSFTYLATDEEEKSKCCNLPWADKRAFAVGDWARRQAADIPTRTVAAAKSWLCVSRVDRHQPILPWNAPEEVAKISPVEAARRYLEHLVDAWNQAHPEAPFNKQLITLTVPASFDAGARELTREAAIEAGFPKDFVLLEEPQAALYAWLADRGERWRRDLKVGDVILVCDVGGGTTDFTLIEVTEEKGDLQLNRLAVGNHILVGGDNMDLALAHLATQSFAEKGVQVNAWQSVGLWHACRTAKEQLLSAEAPESVPVAVLGRGSKVVGGAISTELKRADVERLLLEGFLPACALGDKPARRSASGFRELGLPFESDAAITRHLSQFLTAHGQKQGKAIIPTGLLFNGGVFKADRLRDRLLEVMSGWFGKEQTPRILEGKHDYDFAVALGAAAYGRAKHQGGVRIRGGTARAYYVGIETTGPAVPGAPRPLRALCVVPHGMEEGTAAEIPYGEIGVVVGEPAHFRFFSSSVRKQDQPGVLLESWNEEEIEETDSLETTLPAATTSEDGYVPVRFESKITELGVFELWCVSAISDDRWKLEFSVRDDG